MQLNCCKSWGCKNFGKPVSVDYEPISYHLGYPALHCKSCGSYPPLVDNALVTALVKKFTPTQLPTWANRCPNCQGLNIQRSGKTAAGNQRFRCRDCAKVFTPAKPPADSMLKLLMQQLTAGKSATETIKALNWSSKYYYQLLHWCAVILTGFSRLLEMRYLPTNLLALQSESHVLCLPSGLRIWLITSAESLSGYQLLTTHNIAAKGTEGGTYLGEVDNRLDTFADLPLTDALKRRYQQLMNRYHFEDLQYGETIRWPNAPLIQPAPVAYAHFQLLRLAYANKEHIHHYLEQDSCIRSAAIMGVVDEIAQQQAEIFYLFAHPDRQTAFLADGRPVGWWKDRWFSTPFGGYCPVTERAQYRYPFQMRDIHTNQHYFNYLSAHLNPKVKQLAPFNDHLQITQSCYNFIHKDNEAAPASYLNMPSFATSEALLQAAYNAYIETRSY
ncbi:IS1 family transposase [Celerinatantimonas sp. MCCC 1A17872]|uniref:IS1/IS1595 family N-terminal zinc-binding domain-containing protein n=1 Tax=Celerinatantimonas sp. MCCC 1A17872 TaxID=3177514 RepID=UPI0038C1E31E